MAIEFFERFIKPSERDVIPISDLVATGNSEMDLDRDTVMEILRILEDEGSIMLNEERGNVIRT